MLTPHHHQPKTSELSCGSASSGNIARIARLQHCRLSVSGFAWETTTTQSLHNNLDNSETNVLRQNNPILPASPKVQIQSGTSAQCQGSRIPSSGNMRHQAHQQLPKAHELTIYGYNKHRILYFNFILVYQGQSGPSCICPRSWGCYLAQDLGLAQSVPYRMIG